MRKAEVRVRWVNQSPPQEIRSPHAPCQGSEGQLGPSQPQYTFYRGSRKPKSRLSFEQAVAMAASLACQALPRVDQPVAVLAGAVSWALPGKAVI